MKTTDPGFWLVSDSQIRRRWFEAPLRLCYAITQRTGDLPPTLDQHHVTLQGLADYLQMLYRELCFVGRTIWWPSLAYHSKRRYFQQQELHHRGFETDDAQQHALLDRIMGLLGQAMLHESQLREHGKTEVSQFLSTQALQQAYTLLAVILQYRGHDPHVVGAQCTQQLIVLLPPHARKELLELQQSYESIETST